MGKLAQMALGAAVAIGVSAAAIHADNTWFGDRHTALSHWQHAELAVDAKLENFETALFDRIAKGLR